MEVQVGLVGHWGVEEGAVLALAPVMKELQLADHLPENLSKEKKKKTPHYYKRQNNSRRDLSQLTALQTTLKHGDTHIHTL